MVLVGIRETESTEASCEPPHSPKWEDWSLVTGSLLTGLDVVMCGPLDERNKLYSGWRRDLDNIKLLTTHNLMKRNASSLPEAVNWAGENQGKREGMWADTCLTGERLVQHAGWDGKSRALHPDQPTWEVVSCL